jgi:hypothetical protein
MLATNTESLKIALIKKILKIMNCVYSTPKVHTDEGFMDLNQITRTRRP